MIGRGMRSRIGQFASLKHIIPFWEDDSANKKVQLLRNFYMALEEYDRLHPETRTREPRHMPGER